MCTTRYPQANVQISYLHFSSHWNLINSLPEESRSNRINVTRWKLFSAQVRDASVFLSSPPSTLKLYIYIPVKSSKYIYISCDLASLIRLWHVRTVQSRLLIKNGGTEKRLATFLQSKSPFMRMNAYRGSKGLFENQGVSYTYYAYV